MVLAGGAMQGGGGASPALAAEAANLTPGGGKAVQALATAAQDWMLGQKGTPRAAMDRTADAASLAAQIAASTRRRSEFRTVSAPRIRRLRRYLLCRVPVRASRLPLLERATALVDASYYLGVFAALKQQAAANRAARARRARESLAGAIRTWRTHAALIAALRERMQLSSGR